MSDDYYDGFDVETTLGPGDTLPAELAACDSMPDSFIIQFLVTEVVLDNNGIFIDLEEPYVAAEATITNNFDPDYWTYYVIGNADKVLGGQLEMYTPSFATWDLRVPAIEASTNPLTDDYYDMFVYFTADDEIDVTVYLTLVHKEHYEVQASLHITSTSGFSTIELMNEENNVLVAKADVSWDFMYEYLTLGRLTISGRLYPVANGLYHFIDGKGYYVTINTADTALSLYAEEDPIINYQKPAEVTPCRIDKSDMIRVGYTDPYKFTVSIQSGQMREGDGIEFELSDRNDATAVNTTYPIDSLNPNPVGLNLEPADPTILVFRNSDRETIENPYEFTILVTDNVDGATLTFNYLLKPNYVFPIIPEYGPLINYRGTYSPYPIYYDQPFITNVIEYTKTSDVDMELELDYDDTVNIITTDGEGPAWIINSRVNFRDTDGTIVIRGDESLSNVYCPEIMHGARLIPFTGDMVPKLTFEGVIPNEGALIGGGYKYYFKLLTADRTETNVIEESRLVSVHDGNMFGSSFSIVDGKKTNNAVKFTLSEITNKSFSAVAVYYSYSVGQTDSIATTLYKIDKEYEIDVASGTCSITHTGYEGTIEQDLSEVTLEYTPISTAKALDQKNNRLLQANTTIKDIRDERLLRAALNCYVVDTSTEIFVSSTVSGKGYQQYADSKNIYYKVGYLPGETYELGINFVFNSGEISDTYPIQGLDFTRADSTNYNTERFGRYIEEFDANTGQNSKGVVRTKDVAAYEACGYTTVHLYTMTVNTEGLADEDLDLKGLGVISYFISRRQRIPDMLAEGMLVNTSPVSASSASLDETGLFIGGKWRSFPIDTEDRSTAIVPSPACLMPFTTEGTIDEGDVPYEGIICGPIKSQDKNNKFVFYSPDIMSNIELRTMLNSTTTHGMRIYKDGKAENTEITTRTKYTIANGTVPYASIPVPPLFNSWNLINEYIPVKTPMLNYIGDNVRSFTDGGFTSRSDRQLGFVVGPRDLADAWTGKNLIPASDLRSEEDIYTLKDLNEGATDDNKYDYKRLLMQNVTYSPYVGVELDDEYLIEINGLLKFPSDEETGGGYTSVANENEYGSVRSAINATNLGLIARIYSSSHGDILTPSEWEARYGNAKYGSYVAISERHPITEVFTDTDKLVLTGGDQYGGYYFQQVWRTGGIEGIPTATSPAAYKDDRSGAGLVETGYVIGFPVRSRINFTLRAKEYGDAVEKEMYKTERQYSTYYNSEELRGNKRPEPAFVNFGNMIQNSVITKVGYDPTVTYTDLLQENRIYVSNPNITSAFENGYRQFKGINFKDYDSDLGSIVALKSFGVLTYIIYQHGVSSIEVMEKAAMQTQDNNNVYIANASILPEKSTNLIPFIGSQHKHSVISTDYGVTGVDAHKKRIWYIVQNAPMIISEGAVQNIIDPWFTEELFDIWTSYDKITKDVTYTFKYSDDSFKSIVYNQKASIWYGTNFTAPLRQFIIKKEKYMLRMGAEGHYALFNPISHPKAMEISANENKTVYGAYFSFIVRPEQVVEFTLDNLIIHGKGVPNRIEILPENLDLYEIIGKYAESANHVTNDRVIPAYTNIFIPLEQDPDISIDAVDSYILNREITEDSKPLDIGDTISLKVNYATNDTETIYHQFTIADIETPETLPGTQKVTLDRYVDFSGGIVHQLFYGWKVPLRLSLMEYYRGATKLSVPTKINADRIAGKSVVGPSESLIYNKNQASMRPGGKYVEIRLYFDGMEPIYIDSVNSQINTIYS